MAVKDAIDSHVRHRLEDTFGKALAMLIFMAATNESKAPTIDPSRDDYMRLVESICRDKRVLDMWGSSGASDALRQWQALV